MKRRSFITLLSGAAATWPLAARGQQAAMPVIGVLGAETPLLWASRLRAFRQGLSETGYIEGRNVAIEYRWAEGRNDRLPALAADLVRQRVDAVIVGGNAAALAAKGATSTIPIVFTTGGDPMQSGFIASFNHPGGNLTGVSSMAAALGPKRLELVHECLPKATVVALLVNQSSPTIAQSNTEEAQAAARTLGLTLHVLHASTERDFDAVFSDLRRMQASALVVGSDTFFNSQNQRLAALSLGHAMPTIYQFREFAAAGGLMSYGASQVEVYREVGIYAGRILKGEKPADLPVQQATKVELIINLKTAKALGITVPLSLLGRADEVIE
jgi:putative ABC transport system substrate-binding protein